MNNEETIREVIKWQESPYTHELTCGNDDCQGVLVPKEVDDNVILVCPECQDYVQTFIPICLIGVDYEELAKPYRMLETLGIINTLKNAVEKIEEILKDCEQDRPIDTWRDACCVSDIATEALEKIKKISNKAKDKK